MDNALVIWVAGGLILWNLVTFAFMGWDKHLARKGAFRISEKTLILSAFLMGGAGSLVGSAWFHHKTKKAKFKLLLPIALLCNFFVLWAIWRNMT